MFYSLRIMNIIFEKKRKSNKANRLTVMNYEWYRAIPSRGILN